jgi:exopolyphosphatase/guanosine-5'-triphosphate,3'-diphosphate pyrophosphatase
VTPELPEVKNPAREPKVAAAIDCGTNSVHLLVAVVDEHGVRPLADESTFLGLGSATAEGQLGPAAIERLVATLVGYARAAQSLGADRVWVVGTEPFRRASDAGVAVRRVKDAIGLNLEVIDHEEEAILTLIGVTGGRRVQGALLVCDVGGGSTELAVLLPDEPPRAQGIRVGSSQLTNQVVRHDPPAETEIQTLRQKARAALARVPRLSAGRLVAVGGSATNLLRILPLAGLDQVLTRARLREIIATLSTEPAALAAERHNVNPARARMLPAGAAILEALLDRFQVDQLEVSDLGIREGLILVVSRSGGRWRRQLATLARGWGPPDED